MTRFPKSARKGPHPSEAPRVDPHLAAAHQSIATCLARAKMTHQALEKAKLGLVPVDLTTVLVANQTTLLQAVAFLLDESLSASGQRRGIRFEEKAEGNGDGKPQPPLIVMP